MRAAKKAVLLSLLGALLALAAVETTHAERRYTVRSGDTPAAIAQRFRVSVGDLLAANRMSRGDTLRPGQELRVPERGVIYVQSGDTLSSIAHDHDVSIRELARQNRIRDTESLRVGQRLLLPGHEAAEEREAAESRWGRPRRPGLLKMVRMSNQDRLEMRVIDNRGRVRRAAIRRLAPLMASRRTGRRHPPHRRLVALLSQISDHFGGRPIYLISGFRPPGAGTRRTSRHASGRAADIRVRGVPNTALRDYCRTLHDAGCGYYPRSRFVHVDAREESAYWVDWSRPGEPPQYRRADERPPEGEDGDASAGAEEAGEGDAPEAEASSAPEADAATD